MTVHALETAVRHFNIGRGVTKTSLHLFRHTFAKNYIMAGGGMAKALDSKILEKTSIIPSTGAQNVKHLCSILMGWGFKFLAVFDYDKEGIRCAKDLNKELNLIMAPGNRTRGDKGMVNMV